SRYTGIRRNGFNSEIQLVQLWELRDVKSGAVCCTPWSADRCNVIVRDRVDIQGCIAAYKGKTVREIEVAEARSRIISRKLFPWSGIARIEEALKKSVQCYRSMPSASEDNGPLETEFKVHGRTERKHLGMHPRTIWRSMALEAADKKVISHWAYQLRKEKDVQWFDSIDSKRINVFGIVGPSHCAA